MSKKPWIWRGVQVERHDAVDAGMGDQVGDELGRDRRARAGFAILPGVAEIGDHRGDAARRGAAQRVGDDQQLHQMVVGRERGRLDDEGIRAADVLLDLDEDLHVGEAPYHGLGQRQVQALRRSLARGPGLELPATSLMEPFLADIDASPRALLDTTFSIIGIPTERHVLRRARKYQGRGLQLATRAASFPSEILSRANGLAGTWARGLAVVIAGHSRAPRPASPAPGPPASRLPRRVRAGREPMPGASGVPLIMLESPLNPAWAIFRSTRSSAAAQAVASRPALAASVPRPRGAARAAGWRRRRPRPRRSRSCRGPPGRRGSCARGRQPSPRGRRWTGCEAWIRCRARRPCGRTPAAAARRSIRRRPWRSGAGARRHRVGIGGPAPPPAQPASAVAAASSMAASRASPRGARWMTLPSLRAAISLKSIKV